MKTALTPDAHGGGWLQELHADGSPAAEPRHVGDLAGHLDAAETAEETPRWVLAETRLVYPPLLERGTRLTRTWDATLTEAILLSTEKQAGQPAGLAAAHARMNGLPVPEAPTRHAPEQDTLFDTAPASDPLAELATLVAVHRNQRERLHDAGLGYLIAAESAGGLIAAEMTHHGLPWRRDIHDQLLTNLVGPRPVRGMRPKKLQQLADEISEAFGHRFNPDSPQQVIDAFHQAGHPIESTRAWEISDIDHPAVTPLLRYKELARVHSAHGWTWLRDWVSDGPLGTDHPHARFRPTYVVGGVVTGRWATDGGGALQIPKALRPACHADDGWKLIVADAAQLEPRVLAAMSHDDGMASAAGADDLYAALAPTFDGSRDDAKIALLSAMYGGTAGNASALLAVMKRRFPRAWDYVQTAAHTGETGGLVSTWLGRTCPPPSNNWWNKRTESTRAIRDRGRFTRNFVVQGTAAEWALTMMAYLRGRLRDLGELVFFQHDEIIIHCPGDNAEQIREFIQDAADAATRVLFQDTPVRIPLTGKIVDHYGEAK
ncbi:DNA polymerase-1 [Stackebrandtia endophytica]|uniref:DNA-directed DNA polymerase n=1 Tax=Stackebrandtia endophytica TaxID=1496996 RepID=A0A543AQY3_9ACTN|nr:bifunctional 3'-5' exonuclease/DNA polymerase [Stackebrandtia endophytica]TQL74979.1 DNA polymerase-1 [Stackebrandtia endophytica]